MNFVLPVLKLFIVWTTVRFTDAEKQFTISNSQLNNKSNVFALTYTSDTKPDDYYLEFLIDHKSAAGITFDEANGKCIIVGKNCNNTCTCVSSNGMQFTWTYPNTALNSYRKLSCQIYVNGKPEIKHIRLNGGVVVDKTILQQNATLPKVFTTKETVQIGDTKEEPPDGKGQNLLVVVLVAVFVPSMVVLVSVVIICKIKKNFASCRENQLDTSQTGKRKDKVELEGINGKFVSTKQQTEKSVDDSEEDPFLNDRNRAIKVDRGSTNEKTVSEIQQTGKSLVDTDLESVGKPDKKILVIQDKRLN